MKKKQKDRADRLWVLIHMTAIRLTQESKQRFGGEVQATPLVQRRG